ncbi:hypothetical protein H483_0116830 [Dietzia sp. UCD-THP]|nr:hypothetical protein H483_0116830 [Dietzia sp. UCD-THP]
MTPAGIPPPSPPHGSSRSHTLWPGEIDGTAGAALGFLAGFARAEVGLLLVVALRELVLRLVVALRADRAAIRCLPFWGRR